MAQRGVTTGVQYSGEAMFVAPSDSAHGVGEAHPVRSRVREPPSRTAPHAHKAADVTNVLSAAVPTDLATAHVYAIALKNALNEHLAAPDYHASVVPFGEHLQGDQGRLHGPVHALLLTIDIQRVLRTHLFSAAPALVLQNA